MVSVQSKLSSYSEKECGFQDCKNFLVNAFLNKDHKEQGRVSKPFRKKKHSDKKQTLKMRGIFLRRLHAKHTQKLFKAKHSTHTGGPHLQLPVTSLEDFRGH